MRSNFREVETGQSALTRDVIAARALPGIGDVSIRRVAMHAGAIQATLGESDIATRDSAYASADATIAAAAAVGARVVTVADEEYPERLRDLHDAPSVLFLRGALATAAPPAVAIVGTRNASSYGIRIARAIATRCVQAGISVVSGLAQGIDGAAHEAALSAGGRTVAVLGTGLDVVFPRRHRTLQERIGVDGLLMSELPPGMSGSGATFPRRNRIIAALADVTVVVEAGIRSGALITADHAATLGRRVACVPQAIDVPSAAGSNRLLKDGAEPILSPDDVLQLFELAAEPTPAPMLDADAAACWDALQRGATDVVSMAREAALPLRAAVSALTALELEGLVHVDPDGRVRASVAAAVQCAR